MKCPKCGYTSFESNDSCGKCGNSLSDFRESHGLTPIVLPARLRATMAAAFAGDSPEEDQNAVDGGNDMFSFDLPQHDEPAAPQAQQDPFAAVSQPAAAAPAQHDPFAELLETSPQTPAAAQAPAGAGSELNSFSWDDTPAPSAPGAAPAASPQKVDDDFSSLFGDLGSPNK